MCSHELALLRALCGKPEEPSAAELAVILAYIAIRAEGHSYDESAIESYLTGPAPSLKDMQRAAAQVVGCLDRTTLPAFRQAAVVLSAIGSPEAAIAWEGIMQHAIDEQERRDAAVLHDRLRGTSAGSSPS